MAEKLLLKCLPQSSNVDSFDLLRYNKYHSVNNKIDIEKLPCTSSSLKFHIQRAFMESFKIKNCLMSGELIEACSPNYHGYEFDDKGNYLFQSLLDHYFQKISQLRANALNAQNQTYAHVEYMVENVQTFVNASKTVNPTI